MNNFIRAGRFTSSQIYKLIKSGRGKNDEFSAAGLSYIEDKRIELKLQDSIDSDSYSRPAAWGLLLEKRVGKLLQDIDYGYLLQSQQSKINPDKELAKYWCGTPDFVHLKDFEVDYISELKCYGKKNFVLYTECLLSQDLERFKNDFPAEYWQIVSNCCIYNCDYGEAITYMPYQSEAQEIQDMAYNYDEDIDAWKYRFIYEEKIENLNFLKDNGAFLNLNRFKFEIPKEDKDLLKERIKKAIKLLKI